MFDSFERRYEVFQSGFWMGSFGGPTPKRHTLWSSDAAILECIHRRGGHLPREDAVV